MLALVVVPENLKNLRRSLERDDRLRSVRIEIMSWEDDSEVHLHGKVCLIR